jgi:multiple sugar transport system permease protein
MRKNSPAVSILFWILISLVTLFPIYWMFVVSAKSRVELFGKPNFIIRSFFSENYINTLTNPTFQKYMINSLIVATANSLLVTVLALLATYAVSRYKLAGKENIISGRSPIAWRPRRCFSFRCSFSIPGHSASAAGSSTIPASD